MCLSGTNPQNFSISQGNSWSREKLSWRAFYRQIFFSSHIFTINASTALTDRCLVSERGKKKRFFAVRPVRDGREQAKACTIWSMLNKLYTATFFLPFTCRFCPISHSSRSHAVKKSSEQKHSDEGQLCKKKNSSSELTNIDWIFSACASILLPLRFACNSIRKIRMVATVEAWELLNQNCFKEIKYLIYGDYKFSLHALA